MHFRRNLATAHGHGHGHGHGEHGDHGHDDHGHDDHGHHEPYIVPHYTKYNNWQVSPELVAHQTRLNAIGLKDPWIRNHAWYYHPDLRKNWGWPKYKLAIFGGWKYGAAAAGIAIVFTEALMYYNKTKETHDDHKHHDH